MKEKKIKAASIFFVIAFTFAIFSFSLANSVIAAKKNYEKRFNIDNNKIITFELEEDIDVKDMIKEIEKDGVTISLARFIANSKNQQLNGYEIYTKVNLGNIDPHDDLIKGKYFSQEDFNSEDKVFISTMDKDKNKELSLDYTNINGEEEEIKLKNVGQISSQMKSILVPNKVFFQYTNGSYVMANNISIYLAGEKTNLDNCMNSIEEYVKGKSPNNKITTGNVYFSDKSIEASFLIQTTILIAGITVLNSVCISFLWVQDKKKELVLKKVCGARNRNLFFMFFKELTILSIISMALATIIHFIIVKITGGVVIGIDIRMSLTGVLYSFILAIVTAYITAIPAYSYISKVQPTEILRGE